MMEKEIFEGQDAYGKTYGELWLPTSSPSHILILLNGWTRPQSDFRFLRKLLHQENPLLATLSIENKGCGKTLPVLQKFSLEDMAKDTLFMISLLKERFPNISFSLLGLSMGGMIAQIAAASFSFSKCIFISTRLERPDIQLPVSLSLEETISDIKRYLGKSYHKKDSLLRMLAQKRIQEEENEDYLLGRNFQFQAMDGFSSLNFLSKIKCPTLVLAGDEDQIVTPSETLKLYEHLPLAKLSFLPQVGHMVLIESPSLIASYINEFIQVY